MISLQKLSKSFGKQAVLSGLNLEISQGEAVAIVGPSGTGKSVLLKLITGLLEPTSGSVLINGCPPGPASNENIGVLFQFAALFDSMTVYENVAFPLVQRGFSRGEIARKVEERLAELEMLDYHSSLPGEISIGMRKRVGIARALVSEPELILFDEPNTGLDPKMGQEIYEIINRTRKSRGFTAVVISHEIPEVFQVCERVVMLYGGDVKFDGSVESFKNSEDPIVRQFSEGRTDGPIQVAV